MQTYPVDLVIFATSICTLVTAIAGVLMGVRNKKAIQEIHVSLNSRLTELLKITGEAAHAAGVKDAMDTSVKRKPR